MSCFNLCRPPTFKLGDPTKAGVWVDHTVYPNDADHIIKWNAHRLQHLEIKINHARVLGGNMGIGKDTMQECAIGPWNFAEVTPAQAMGRFNSFLKSVILRISEGRDLGE